MKRRVRILALAALATAKKRKIRKTWCKEWLLRRNELSHTNLLNELRLEPEDWFNYLRMDEETYLYLLKLVTPLIIKQDTHLRKAITPHERLTVTLRYIATGRSYEDLKFSSIISAQALGHIIPETCMAIYTVLKAEYLKFPKTQEEWKAIANKFEEKWNFPNCLGAVDGKHVQITAPYNSGSYFWNYKGFNSLVLLAIANADYELIMVNFGVNSRVSDGGVIENTLFYEKLRNGTLHLPPSTIPIRGTTPLPFVFIGDEAFSLRKDFLKPYSQKTLTPHTRIFNYRLSRARRIIENVFGIMAARFRVFHVAIPLNLENTEKVVMACCVLHNFLRRHCASTYSPSPCFDIEHTQTGDLEVGLRPPPNTLTDFNIGRSRNASQDAKRVREEYVKYFNNEGSVSWQHRFV